MSAPASSDRNLLCGVFALRRNLISSGQLIEAMNAWAERRSEPLADLLRERGWLADASYQELLREVDARPAGDSAESPTTVGPGESDSGAPPTGGAMEGSGTPVQLIPQPTAPPRPYAPRYGNKKEHARGGLGVVYSAVDGELQREVALKEIQHRHADSADSRRRFVREAEVTGNLEHPGIVPVYGLGVYPDGRPYYAMRFIRGESMQKAIKRHHAAPSEMGLRGLLGRFVAMCNAVAYAHSRGVIHRDLKPDNVMLGDFGETLVVDWGLAKVVAQPAADDGGAVLPLGLGRHAGGAVSDAGGTIAFMPPEQARGDWANVGPAADVFALGATLYTLLTGRLANTSLEEARRGEVKLARRVNANVPKPLEAVCAKAMAASPAGRYATATELAAEVERWLADEPVTAYREPWRVKARRWAKRHAKVVTGGVVLLAAGVVGLGLGLWAVEVQRQETLEAKGEAEDNLTLANERLDRALKAEREAKDNLKQATDNLKLATDAVDGCYRVVTENKLFQGQKLSKEAHDLKRLLLVQALPFYKEFRERRPGDRGALRDLWAQHSRVGHIQQELGSKPDALESYRQAEQVARQLTGTQPGEPEYQAFLAATLNNLANVQSDLGRRKEALKSYAEAINLHRALVKAQPAVPAHQVGLALALTNFGNLRYALGQRPEAVKSYTEAIDLRRALVKAWPGVGEYQTDLAGTLTSLANVQAALGQLLEALKSYAEAADLRRALVEGRPGVPEHQADLARTLTSLGNFRSGLGQPKEALTNYVEAADLRRALVEGRPGVPEYQAGLAAALNNLANAQHVLGRRKEALKSYAEAAVLGRALVKAQPGIHAYQNDLASALANLGHLQSRLGQPKEALKSYAEAADLRRGLVKAHPDIPGYCLEFVKPLVGLAMLLRQLRRPEEARRALDEALTALAGLKQSHPSHPDVDYFRFLAQEERAHALAAVGKFRDAVRAWDQALPLAPADERTEVRLTRAGALARAGEHDRAAAEAADLSGLAALTAGVFYDLACVLAISADGAYRDIRLPLPRREGDAKARAHQAVVLLGRAALAGHFQGAAVTRLDKDPDLAFLRPRDDYKRFRASLPSGK